MTNVVPFLGLRSKRPVVFPYHESEAKYKKHVQMDYWTRAAVYSIRPEAVNSS